MQRRLSNTTNSLTKGGSGVGGLQNCPYYFFDYVCNKCKQQFSFTSRIKCNCQLLHKYFTKPIVVNQIHFDGFREGVRYSKLFFLQDKGVIKDLKVHPVFDLVDCTYEADFSYIFESRYLVEDVKWKETDVFKLKKKLLRRYFPNINLIIIKN